MAPQPLCPTKAARDYRHFREPTLVPLRAAEATLTAAPGKLGDQAIAADPAAPEQVRDGDMKAARPLVGHVMRGTKPRADGGEITRLQRAFLLHRHHSAGSRAGA